MRLEYCNPGEHPELIETMSILPHSGMTYTCSKCGKELIISTSAIMTPARAVEVNKMIADAIYQVFGVHLAPPEKQLEAGV